MNTIDLAKSYKKAIDLVYTHESLTDVLRGQTRDEEFLGANEIKVLKVATQGLATHVRGAGYTQGDVDAHWETMTLTQQRSRKFRVDREDNEETLDLTMGAVAGSFVREKVVPEVDAYRFTKLYGRAGDQKTGTFTTTNALVDSIDQAVAARYDAGVPKAGLLYVRSDLQSLLNKVVNTVVIGSGEILTNVKKYNELTVIPVPTSRFYTGITLLDGKTEGEEAGGYVNAGQKINFMLVEPSAVIAPAKLAMPKLFDPDSDDDDDCWRFLFRLYHDLFVFDNKTTGITVNSIPAAGG